MTAPTAAQRELARRLDAEGAPRGVVELVVAVPLAGRGGVDSARVDERELLRACVSALAFLAGQLPAEAPTRATRTRWWRRPRPVEPVPVPVDDLVGAWWEQRVRAGSGVRWRRVWDTAHARGRLPVVGLGVVPVLDPIGTDLLRRLNLALATAPDDVRTRAARLVPHRPAPALGVPRPHLTWAMEQARRQGLVVPSTDPGRSRRVPVTATLARAMEELSWRSA